MLCPLGSRDLFVTGPGPASGGPNPSPGCAHRPARAGTVAGPCPAPAADGAVDWPKTGVAIAPANTTAKRELRGKFMARLAFWVPLTGYNFSKVPESLPRAPCPGRGRTISAVMQKRVSAPDSSGSGSPSKSCKSVASRDFFCSLHNHRGAAAASRYRRRGDRIGCPRAKGCRSVTSQLADGTNSRYGS